METKSVNKIYKGATLIVKTYCTFTIFPYVCYSISICIIAYYRYK